MSYDPTEQNQVRALPSQFTMAPQTLAWSVAFSGLSQELLLSWRVFIRRRRGAIRVHEGMLAGCLDALRELLEDLCQGWGGEPAGAAFRARPGMAVHDIQAAPPVYLLRQCSLLCCGP